MKKINVMFLCTGNTARSQMAEAFLRRLAGDRFEVFSAGLHPGPIHPLTRVVMAELGYDLAGHTSKDIAQYLGKQHFGYLITVCSRAEQECPIFPGVGQRTYWPLDDPAAATGTDAQRLAKFRQVRDAVQDRIRQWLAELDQDAAG